MGMAIMVTNVAKYEDSNLKTGLWLSELTHIYHNATQQNDDIVIASPKGGDRLIDPESLKPLVLDKISKDYWADSAFRNLLQHTKSLRDLAGQNFDCVYLADGHGTVYDFPNDTDLQNLIREQPISSDA